uniref:Uncharacterized protein n=1 Tax=Anguilla anguilla TaxID=7936 RepID=A0A0E9SRK6_ANGAN
MICDSASSLTDQMGCSCSETLINQSTVMSCTGLGE